MTVKFPDATVQLSGQDGNAFVIISRTVKELKRAGATKAETDEFMDDAMSGNYDHALQTVMSWVNVE